MLCGVRKSSVVCAVNLTVTTLEVYGQRKLYGKITVLKSTYTRLLPFLALSGNSCLELGEVILIVSQERKHVVSRKVNTVSTINLHTYSDVLKTSHVQQRGKVMRTA